MISIDLTAVKAHHTWIAQQNKLIALGYSVNRYTYPPGTCFPNYDHTVAKIDAVLSGRFKMTMYGKSLVLEAGDLLEIPCGVVHSAEVFGDQPVMSLDAIKIK